jgi:hypothetical protein
MNQSFETPMNPPEGQDTKPLAENTEGSVVSSTEESPVFSEKNIDRERLRTAIEIAQAEEGTASKRFVENRAKQIEAMNEEELRTEIERAERNGKEDEARRLEELILNREKERPVEAREEPKEIENSPDIPEEVTQATEAVSPVNEEAPQEQNDQGGTYAERLSALAQERDPLGLARVALRETLETLGTTEVAYMKAGPFEELVATDKLDVVREFEAFKAKTRKYTLSETDYALHLKGLIYDRITQQPNEVAESILQDGGSEAEVQEPAVNETPENASEAPTIEPAQETAREAPVGGTSGETLETVTPETQEETALGTRQQNKIIKIIESGNLDVLDQPIAEITDGERDSFFEKVRGGEVTEATLDSVIRNIAAPFSGSEGVQMLYEQLQGDESLLRDVGEIVREGLYAKDAVRREGWRPTAEELVSLLKSTPPLSHLIRLLSKIVYKKYKQRSNKRRHCHAANS